MKDSPVAVNAAQRLRDGRCVYRGRYRAPDSPSSKTIGLHRRIPIEGPHGRVAPGHAGRSHHGTQSGLARSGGSGTTVAAGAVIDEDCYATDSTAFRAATTTATGAEEQLIEVRNINTIANFVWEDGGLSEDPKVPLRIAVTMSATGTAVAGDITLVCLYTVD